MRLVYTYLNPPLKVKSEQKIYYKHRAQVATFSTEATHYYTSIKTFSTREGLWFIGIKGDGGVKSKGTRLLIEKE